MTDSALQGITVVERAGRLAGAVAATMLAELGAFAFWEMVVFIAILVLGLAYVWAKGDLDWVKGLVDRDADEFSPLSRYSSGDLEEHWDAKPREIDHDAA